MVRLIAVLLVALSLSTATAHANAVPVSAPPDPVAGVEFPITATWSTRTAPSA